MQIPVPYGRDEQLVTLADYRVAGTIYPNDVETPDETETLQSALSNPICSVPFEEFLQRSTNVLVIVNDGARPTPTAKILDIIEPALSDVDVRFIIATGCHRAPTEEELQFIFGRHVARLNGRISIHDSRAEDEMVHIGSSKSGTEMWINRRVLEADQLVVIGSVEPHYFAGYTGGRKAFLPGLSSYRTIEQNHKHALRSEARVLTLEGNPVHEDTLDALKALEVKPIFSIQAVLDRHRRIYAARAGHIHESFYAAIEKAKEVFCVKIDGRADIVVSVAPYPMDVDLYQSQKALENGKLALKDGGILILVSKCREGIGHETFLELLRSHRTQHDILEKIAGGYSLGYHKAARLADLGSWAELWAVTDLSDDLVRAVRMRPFDSVQDALNEALKAKGPEAKTLFLMDGSTTVPMVA
jgi:nickel-dependent lactate racemase